MTEEIKVPEKSAERVPSAPQLSSEEKKTLALAWLEEASPEEILRVRRVGGIIGQRMETSRQQVRQEITAEMAIRAKKEAQEELEKLAKDDPTKFSERYLSDLERERVYNQRQELEQSVQKEYADEIGAALRDLTTEKELTPEEFTRLQTALEGKQGKATLRAFTATAADIIADRKSEKRLAEYRAKELPKEREALRAEEAAKQLQISERPDIGKSEGAPGKFDPTTLDDKKFEEYYRKTFLARR